MPPWGGMHDVDGVAFSDESCCRGVSTAAPSDDKKSLNAVLSITCRRRRTGRAAHPRTRRALKREQADTSGADAPTTASRDATPSITKLIAQLS